MDGVMELGLNAAMIALLGATIFYCWLLNRRIQVLQDSKSELSNLLKQFDRSTRRATDAMDVLQKASKQAGKSVQSRIEKAQYILDDLNYMMDRADKIADQMEAGIAIARQREKLEPAVPSVPSVSPQPVIAQKETPQETPQEVPRQSAAIKVSPAKPIARPMVAPRVVKPESLVLAEFEGNQEEGDIISDITRDSILASLREAKANGKKDGAAMSSLQSLIEKVAERNEAASDEDGVIQPVRMAPARMPSRGERELLKAIGAGAE